MFNTRRTFLICFFLANLILSSFYLDTWENSNTASRVLPVVSFCESGKWEVDRYHGKSIDLSFVNNHYYSDKAPLPSLFVIPFFKAAQLLGLVDEREGSLYGKEAYAIGAFLCGSLPFSLILLLAFKKSQVRGFGNFPVVVTMVSFYGSFLFVFSGTFFGHLFASALLLISLIFIEKGNFLSGGIFAGLSFLSDYTLGIAIPLWTVLVFLKRKKLLPGFLFFAGSLPPIIFILLYNHHLTGNALTMLTKYVGDMWGDESLRSTYGFIIPDGKTLLTVIFRQYLGLLIYAPVIILIIFHRLKGLKLSDFQFLAGNYIFVFCIGLMITVAGRGENFGGWTYGPRYLTAIAVLLLFYGSVFFEKNKWLFLWIGVFGLLCSFLAKFTVVYSVPTNFSFPLTQLILPEFFAGNLNPNNWFTTISGIKPATGAVVWLIMFFIFLYLFNKWDGILRRHFQEGPKKNNFLP